jgi:hypothetical protein
MFVLGNSEDLLLCQAAQTDAIFQCDHVPANFSVSAELCLPSGAALPLASFDLTLLAQGRFKIRGNQNFAPCTFLQ